MKIKMKRTLFTLLNEWDMTKLEAGKEYNLRQSDACRIVSKGAADLVKEVA